MAKAWYIVPVVEETFPGGHPMFGVGLGPGNRRVEITTRIDTDEQSENHGRPLKDWCLIMIDTDETDHQGLAARNGWIALPNGESRALRAADSGRINQILARTGIDLTAATTTDEVTQLLGKAIQPGFRGKSGLKPA